MDMENTSETSKDNTPPLGCREIKGLGFIKLKAGTPEAKAQWEARYEARHQIARELFDATIKAALYGKLAPEVTNWLNETVEGAPITRRQLLGRWVEEIGSGQLVITNNYLIADRPIELKDILAVGGSIGFHIETPKKVLTGQRIADGRFIGVVLNLDSPAIIESFQASQNLVPGQESHLDIKYEYIFQAVDAAIKAHRALTLPQTDPRPLLNQEQLNRAVSWALFGT